MTENKRFDLTFNQNDQWDIIDKLESEQKNAICIYNDLGQTCFSSAPQVCELMNGLHEENEQLKHDATVLICSNQEYRKENEQLKKENKELKAFLTKLADSQGNIYHMNGRVYNIQEVI